jgi:predicted cupin superfamily sugar epimerase
MVDEEIQRIGNQFELESHMESGYFKPDLQLPVQSAHITTKVASSNPVHGEVHSIRHYVIKFATGRWFSPHIFYNVGCKPSQVSNVLMCFFLFVL